MSDLSLRQLHHNIKCFNFLPFFFNPINPKVSKNQNISFCFRAKITVEKTDLAAQWHINNGRLVGKKSIAEGKQNFQAEHPL